MSGLGCKTPNLKIKIMIDSSLYNTCKIIIKISFQTNLKVNAYDRCEKLILEQKLIS